MLCSLAFGMNLSRLHNLSKSDIFIEKRGNENETMPPKVGKKIECNYPIHLAQ